MQLLNKVISTDTNGKYLYNWKYIEKIPEFAALKDKQQNPKWHGEGDAWEHTKKVCEYALTIVNSDDDVYDLNGYWKEILLASCLFHDIGKGVSSFQGKDGRWHSYGHEETGEKITRRLLWDDHEREREKICSLVRWHMEPIAAMESKAPLERIVFLSKRVPSIKMLYLVKLCDMKGSIMEERGDLLVTMSKLSLFKDFASTMKIFDSDNHMLMTVPKLREQFNRVSDKRKVVTVFLMIGLPGAGKDTWISKYSSLDNVEVITRDDIRAEMGLCKPGEKIVASHDDEERVTEECNKRILSAAKNGKLIILNGINLKRKYRDAYKKLLSNYLVNWVYVYVETDSLQTNLERRNGQISREVFENMIANFEWPDYDEYDTLKVVLNGCDERLNHDYNS